VSARPDRGHEPVPVRVERRGSVALIVLEHPPVNALSQPVRQALLAAIEDLDGDAAVAAIVLHGAGRNFIAGADVREFDQAARAPLLFEVLNRIEACTKPVVAALHGAALGGGAETALACHYRCATADLQFGFPEVTLGLIPGSGGTVRLPRIVGVPVALDLMIRGESIDAATALSLGLVDRLLETRGGGGDDRDEAIKAAAAAYALTLNSESVQARRISGWSVPDVAAATSGWFREYRHGVPAARRGAAGEAIVHCVEAAAQRTFAGALAFTRESFERCRSSEESRALRYLFFAERAAGRIGAKARARVVEEIGVVGAGTMGSGIALCFAQAGVRVVLVDADATALQKGMARIHALLEGAVKKGRSSAQEAEAVTARVQSAASLTSLTGADLVIEAVFEDLTVKQALFAQLARVCRPGAILATNTSTLDIDAIAATTGRAQDVVGMHFFSPAHVMRLIEVVRGRETSERALATVLRAAKRAGKIGVTVGNCFGFVGNRMLYAYGREKELMLLEGAAPAHIDGALESFGMAMGPNAVGDLAGLDIGAAARRAWPLRPDDPRFYRISDLLAERGWLGQKTGRGFYLYEPGSRARQENPEVMAVIRSEAARLGIARREVPAEEIVQRCVFALINEGVRILEEGIADRASDIDVIWCNGYGFPRARGGPMFYADRVGLGSVLTVMDELRRRHGDRYWAAAPLLERLAREGRSLAEWTAAPAAA
jgi:3-hydroxyacyl-CoA dehydrogenase